MKLIIKILIIGVCLTGSHQAKAQYFKHGGGFQLNIFNFKDSYTSDFGSGNPLALIFVPGFNYKASLGFELTQDVTLSASSYPFIGLRYNSFGGGYFGAEIPLLAEIFIGDVDYFGFFVGAGVTFAYTANASNFGNGFIFGPQIDGGIQFPFRDRIIALRLAYTYGLNNPSVKSFPERTYTKSERNMFSLGLAYIFN